MPFSGSDWNSAPPLRSNVMLLPQGFRGNGVARAPPPRSLFHGELCPYGVRQRSPRCGDCEGKVLRGQIVETKPRNAGDS